MHCTFDLPVGAIIDTREKSRLIHIGGGKFAVESEQSLPIIVELLQAEESSGMVDADFHIKAKHEQVPLLDLDQQWRGVRFIDRPE